MNQPYSFLRRQLLWCIAILTFAFSFAAKAGDKNEINKVKVDKNLTKEQLVGRYSFFKGDSLANFDFEGTYKKALEVSHISIEQEMKNFFGIEERSFLNKKYHIAEIEPQRPGRDYRNPVTPACANLDFEYGDWTGWNGGYGYNTNSAGPLTITGMGILNGALCNPVSACTYHTLCSTSCPNDAYGPCAVGIPVVDPGGGNFTARLGGDQINLYEGFCNLPTQDWTFSAGEYIEQTVVVTPSNALFTYSYQVVLEDAPHAAGEQPYFHAEVFDQFGNSLSSCFEYYVQSIPNTGGPPPGFFASCVFGYSYLPWTQNSINLTSQLGNPITVRFTCAGCKYGGHSAHAYVDVSCSAVQIVVTDGMIPCNGTTTLVAPPAAGGTYTWAGPGIVGSNTSQIITVNAAGTYTVTIHPTTGCDYTLSTYVNAAPTINGTINHSNALCNGSPQGVVWTGPIGGTAPYTYAWTPSGNTTATVSNLLAGTYTTTITDVNGCTYTGTTTITQPTALAANTTPTNLSCYNVPTGSAIVNANGGSPGYSYTWSTSPAQHGQTATNLAAGNYTVTVTDANNCTRVQAVQITQPTQLVAPTAPTPVSCNGGNNGSVTVNPNGGTSPYTYAWSSGSTTSTASNLTAGNYTVTVTDRNGCTKVSIAAVTQPTAVTSVANGSPVACFAGNNGSASVAANGGSPAYTYLWSPSGGTGITANTLTAGNYTCTITDSHGCSILQPYTVTQPTAVVSAIPSHSDVSCNGGNNGTATASANGGTPPYTYAWSSGSSTIAANNLAAGTYTVTVTDSHGCSQTSNVVITEPTALTNNMANSNVSCYAGSDATAWAAPGGGTAPYTYLWTPTAQTTQTASNLAATTYNVRITDANGCTIVSSVTPTQPLLLTAAMNPPTHVSCNGLSDGTASVSASFGTAPYSYLWTPSAQTTASANGLAAGTYTVLVTDANGCTTTKTVVINEPPLLTSSASASAANCNGATNGSASVIANGGTTPYAYLWSSGNTTATAAGLPAGTYTVTVTDAHGCTQTSTATVGEPTPLIAGTNPPVNVTCFGYANGSASVTANGGVAPYSYLWSPSAQTTQTALNLGPANYTIVVSDSHGCTQTVNVAVTEPPQVTAIASSPTNVTCFGASNGSAYVTPGGGTPPYTYNWSPSAEITQTAVNLGPANYTITVTDANGCSITTNVQITEPPALTAVPAHTNVSCFGVSDGSASVTAGGGVTPYQYSWNPSGQTTDVASNIPAGSYTVTITDANGCIKTSTATVTEPSELLSNTTTPNNVICRGQNNGSVAVVPQGGTPPYTYLWSNGDTNAAADSLFAGTYTATVLDAHGCLSYSTATITQPPLLVAAIPWHTDNLCHGDQLGTAYVDVQGGIPSYQYAWSPAGGTNATAVGMGAGNYTVIITDVNACTTKQIVQITEPPQLMMTVNSPPTICIGQNTDITATVWGGTPPYNYVWDNGPNPNDSTQNVNPVVTTPYNINVTDANGCTLPSQLITVVVNPALQLNASGPIGVCSGTVVTLNSQGSGGNGGPYTYTWSNGETTSSIQLAITQDTTLNVTFSDGCSPSVDTVLSVINNPIPIVNFSPWVTSGCAPLTVDFVDSTITVPGATYAWTLGDGTAANTQTFTHVYPDPGVYDISLTVTTPANCASSLSLPHVVEVFPLPDANFATSTDVVEAEYPFVDFSNYSTLADHWHWDFGDGSTDTSIYSPKHHYTDTGYYSIQLAVMTDNGCVDTIYGRIYVRPEWSIFIPNNFTPNGDGTNDTFNALGTNIIEYDMWILDRWGAKIFHTESMQQNWNGTYFNNGNLCQSDVYVYKIKARDVHGKMHTFIGHVTLWR